MRAEIIVPSLGADRGGGAALTPRREGKQVSLARSSVRPEVGQGMPWEARAARRCRVLWVFRNPPSHPAPAQSIPAVAQRFVLALSMPSLFCSSAGEEGGQPRYLQTCRAIHSPGTLTCKNTQNNTLSEIKTVSNMTGIMVTYCVRCKIVG